MVDRCIGCGRYVPEGRYVCPICLKKAEEKDDCYFVFDLGQHSSQRPGASDDVDPVIFLDQNIEGLKGGNGYD